MVTPLKKLLNMDFDSAVSNVEKVIVEEGFSHLLTKHIDEILKTKLGLEEYPRYTVVLACSPHMAKAALDVSKDVGLLFPCSFSIYEENGEIWIGHISIMKMAPFLGLAPQREMQPVISMTGKAVEACWKKF
jgi:uncharacterized protein (DUF302 family)